MGDVNIISSTLVSRASQRRTSATPPELPGSRIRRFIFSLVSYIANDVYDERCITIVKSLLGARADRHESSGFDMRSEKTGHQVVFSKDLAELQ